MMQAIKELEYCIVRERGKISEYAGIISQKLSIGSNYEKGEYKEKISVCNSKIKEFQDAIQIISEYHKAITILGI